MSNCRIEHEGFSVRFGDDANPLPVGEQTADIATPVRVAITPPPPWASVVVTARNGDAPLEFALTPTSTSESEHLYSGAFPAMPAGTHLTYEIAVKIGSEPAPILLRASEAAGAPELSFRTTSRERDPIAPAPIPAPIPVAPPARVSGTIALEDGSPPPAGLKIRAVQIGLGGRTAGAEAVVDAQGNYKLPTLQKTGPEPAKGTHVELVAVLASGEEVPLTASVPGGALPKVMNLLVPSTVAPARSEHDRLTESLNKPLAAANFKLSAAIERGDRQDITVLTQETGWDARVVAIASQAEAVAEATAIPAAGLYALGRAGIPFDKRSLANLPQQVVADALAQSAEGGIIDAAKAKAAQEAFVAFAKDARLSATAPGFVSSPKEFIARAGISEADKKAFQGVVAEEPRGDVWARAKAANVSDAGIARLKLQGKLAFLTLNNAELTEYLLGRVQQSPTELIALGFHRPALWEKTLRDLAKSDAKLTTLIPSSFHGSLADRLAGYADELARRVRVTDPPAATAARISENALEGLDAESQKKLARFFGKATPLGFRLGETSLRAFADKNDAALFASPAERTETLDAVTRLAALNSISPSDDMLGILWGSGIRSASQIAALGEDTFFALVNAKGRRTGLKRQLKDAFWKAKQVSATVYSIFDGMKRLETAGNPGVGGAIALTETQRAQTLQTLKGQFPTLENLFGSVDFCECKDCQSVLSPAAYLVDTLKFLDPKEPEEWTTVKEAFKKTYGQAYPAHLKPPFFYLSRRRPDLAEIPLTCANTNVALPYIDLTNEVLEQVVAGKTPIAFDTGEATSEELIAEPQNITWEAYEGAASLQSAVFPRQLPFDLPLETVRALLDELGVPLWRTRELLARPSELFAAAGQTNGFADVWFERLGLGPRDVEVLTTTKDPHRLLGYGSGAEALAVDTVTSVPLLTSARNAKSLARRLSISYVDLETLLRTRFVNDGIDELVLLDRLGVDPDVLDAHLDSGAPLGAVAGVLAEAGLTVTDVRPLRATAVRQRTLMVNAPESGCDYAKRWLKLASEPVNPSAAWTLALLKLSAVVRLRYALNARLDDLRAVAARRPQRGFERTPWTIEELDSALMALVPNPRALSLVSWEAAMKTGLVHLAHLEELYERAEGRVSREELLVLWRDLPTAGTSSLFERLFRKVSTDRDDGAFASRLGRYFRDNPSIDPAKLLLADHVETVREALGIDDADIHRILTAAKVTSQELSVSTLSTLVRYSVLARVADLSVAETITLLALHSRPTLDLLGDDVVKQLGDDLPWNQTLAFLRIVDRMRGAGVDTATVARICTREGSPSELPEGADPALLALGALPAADTSTAAAVVARDAAIANALAGHLGAKASTVKLLATKLTSNAKPVGEGLRDPSTRVDALRKLRTAVDLVRSLSITDDELAWLASTTGLLERLPTVAPAPDVAQTVFDALLPWLELVATRKRFARGDRLLDVVRGARHALDANHTAAARWQTLVEALAALTGIAVAPIASALSALASPVVTGTTFEVPALGSIESVGSTVDALALLVLFGTPPAQALDWATKPLARTAAQQVRGALKGRLGTTAWRSKAKPVFDRLRARRRDALVAYLTHVVDGTGTSKYGDTQEKLFRYFLLDPGMEPVVLASRIQRATLSIQTFVDQCLKGIELRVSKDAAGNEVLDGVDPRIIDAERWAWMRVYRVWEANRKLFIWPENWLAPELRDDKTHLYRALEGTLLQGNVDDELVGKALQEYLVGLEGIARLELLTMYFEPSPSGGGTLHVVGRSPTDTSKHFYRTCSYGMWSPWEPLDVGVEGEHLVLTAWRGRMRLAWVTFLEQAVNASTPPTQVNSSSTIQTPPTSTQVQIQLHWVDLTKGKWGNRGTTPMQTVPAFNSLKATTQAEKAAFFIQAKRKGQPRENLEIHLMNGNAKVKFTFFSRLALPRRGSSSSTPLQPAFTALAPSATKWGGRGPLQAKFKSRITRFNGAEDSVNKSHRILNVKDDVGYKLLLPSNESWTREADTVPSAVGRPAVAFFQPQNAHYIVYRGTGGTVYTLANDLNGWFLTSVLESSDPEQAAAEPEPATSDPHAYSLDQSGVFCIVYAGARTIVEHAWAQTDAILDDDYALETAWASRVLYTLPQGSTDTLGKPCGGVFEPRRGAIFRVGTKLFAVRDNEPATQVTAAMPPSPGPVVVTPPAPTPGWQDPPPFPALKSDPVCCIYYKTVGVTKKVETRHVFFIGTDGHIHEVYSTAGATWAYVSMTKAIPNIVLPAEGAVLSAYVLHAQPTLHVVYRGTDDKIYELYRPMTSGWALSKIGATAPLAKTDPTGFVAEKSRTQHVVYQSTNDEIVELYWAMSGGGWKQKVLTKDAVPGAPSRSTTPRGPVGLSSDGTKKQVVYETSGNGLAELVEHDGWRENPIALTNPLRTEDPTLAAPFFFEAESAPHTFFVEPFIVEQTARQWTEWIVTTQELVVPDIRVPKPVAPRIRAVIDALGIVKKPAITAEKAYDDDVLVRTAKGLIGPTGRAVLESAVAVPAVPGAIPAVPGAIPTSQATISGMTLSKPRIVELGRTGASNRNGGLQ